MAAESPVAIINQKGSQPSVGWSAGQPRPTRTEFRARNAFTYESASHASTTGAPLTIDPCRQPALHRFFFPYIRVGEQRRGMQIGWGKFEVPKVSRCLRVGFCVLV